MKASSIGAADRIAPWPTLIGALLIATCLLQSGCGRAQSSTGDATRQKAGAPEAANSPATVELSQTQLGAITVESAGTYAFPVEKEALGSIDFDEDLAVVQAESMLLSAAATFELSSKALARVKSLYSSNGGVPQKELEQAISDHQTAESALKAAHDAVRAFGKTETEIDRIIASRRIESARATGKWTVANVSESDMPFVQMGQPVDITVAPHPGRVFKGKVSRVYTVIDPATHRGKVRCEIADPNNELRPGMLATLRIRVRQPVEAIAVPAETLVREGDGTMTAWVTSDRHRFAQRVVKPGLRSDGRVQILDGIRQGELVVAQGGVFLSNLLQAPPSDD